MVLLAGWKSLCLPVLRLPEPGLAPGALAAAGDSSLANMAGCLACVRDPASGCVSASFPVEDGVELSSRTGRRRRPGGLRGARRAVRRGVRRVRLPVSVGECLLTGSPAMIPGLVPYSVRLWCRFVA